MKLRSIVEYLSEYISDIRLEGDGDLEILGLATIQNAVQNQISFINNKKYLKFLSNSNASVVVLQNHFVSQFSGAKIITEDPYLAWAYISHLFNPKPNYKTGLIHPSSTIGNHVQLGENVTIQASVVIGDDVTIGEGCFIGAGSVLESGVSIGKNTYISPNVTICYNCIIGNSVILHPGVVIGAEGFGFAPSRLGYVKIAQIGRVILEDYVDIGANSCIDRGAIEDTVVGFGTKIDNHVQLGHNCIVGEHTVISGFTGIAGSAKIGSRVVIGGGVGMNGHIEIADDVMITGDTMVTHSLTEKGVYSSGLPVTDNRSWRRNVVQLQQIDKLYQRVKQIEKKLNSENE